MMHEVESADERMPEPLQRAVLAACDAAGAFIEYWGHKRAHGRVWAWLALSARPYTQAELVRTLGMSKAAVSQTMSELEALGLVRRTGTQRTAPWVAELDFWGVVAEQLRRREWVLIDEARTALMRVRDEALVTDPEGRWFRIDQVENLLALTEMALSFLRMIMALRTPEPAETTTTWFQRIATVLDAFRNRRRR